jgi:hypothetical protein
MLFTDFENEFAQSRKRSSLFEMRSCASEPKEIRWLYVWTLYASITRPIVKKLWYVLLMDSSSLP